MVNSSFGKICNRMNSVELLVCRQRNSLQFDTCNVYVHILKCTLQYGKAGDKIGFIVFHCEYLVRDTFLKWIIHGFIEVVSGK